MFAYTPKYIRKVFPGDKIEEDGNKCLGISCSRAVQIGKLYSITESKDFKLLYIKSKTNMYIPLVHDIVIGKVFYSSADYYKIDLGRFTGILPALSFPNASKRNKLELNKNDMVLCQIEKINDSQDKDILLTCIQIGLGKIARAYQLDVWKIKFLYFSDHLAKIAENYKIALGMNGYFFIEAEDDDTEREIVKQIYQFTGN